MALEVKGCGDVEVLWAGDLDLYIVQLFGDTLLEDFLHRDGEAGVAKG